MFIENIVSGNHRKFLFRKYKTQKCLIFLAEDNSSMLNCIILNSTQKQMVEAYAMLETPTRFQTFLHCFFLL